MSRRCLFLTEHEYFLYCGSGAHIPSLQNTLLQPRKIYGSALLDHQLPFCKGGHMVHRRYARLVTLYVRRQLSFPKDILRAFEGITKILTPFFGGFHFGLPLQALRWSLCWMHYIPITPRPGFPSWTWAGWYPAADDEGIAQTFGENVLSFPDFNRTSSGLLARSTTGPRQRQLKNGPREWYSASLKGPASIAIISAQALVLLAKLFVGFGIFKSPTKRARAKMYTSACLPPPRQHSTDYRTQTLGTSSRFDLVWQPSPIGRSELQVGGILCPRPRSCSQHYPRKTHDYRKALVEITLAHNAIYFLVSGTTGRGLLQ